MSASKSAISGKKNDNQYLVLIDNDGTQFKYFILDCRTNQRTSKIKIYANSPKDFIENIFTNFGNIKIKAIFFNIFRMKIIDYSNIVEYCKIIKAKLQQLNIPCYFISNMAFNTTCFFIESKILAKEGDEVITVFVGESDVVSIVSYRYSINGYKFIDTYYVDINANQNSKEIRDKIIKNSHPKDIILFDKRNYKNNIEFLQDTVFTKSDNIIPLSYINDFGYIIPIVEKFLNEKLKWLNDNSYTKYHIIPYSYCECVYFVKVGEKLCSREIVDFHEILPVVKKGNVSNLNLDYSVGYIDGHTYEKVILQKIPYTKNSHKTEITISIDEQYFPDIQIKPIIMDEICEFPKTVNLKTKIPIIAFSDFFSVICCFNDEKNEYEFIDGWNGMYGRPLFISFDKEKPIYAETAVQAYKEKPSFVVSDLVTILSKDPEKNIINDTWGFTVTKDSDNPLLLEFDTFEGTKKVATPIFLMALLLKEHVKSIKAEMGEKPKDLAFFLFDEFDSDAKERLKKGLEESCKLLKIRFMLFGF